MNTIPSNPMLFIFGGLPATGKTSVARELAKSIGACHLRIDTLEQTLIRIGACTADRMEGKGYQIACELAKDQLANQISVIADCVNPLELTRQWWREVAVAAACPSVEVEFFCSDTTSHRMRAENRIPDIEGLNQPDWQQILNREYDVWKNRHLLLDTAQQSISQSVCKILEYAKNNN